MNPPEAEGWLITEGRYRLTVIISSLLTEQNVLPSLGDEELFILLVAFLLVLVFQFLFLKTQSNFNTAGNSNTACVTFYFSEFHLSKF